ncbi:MAG: 3-isopropylmalate/(R)-2-methylmalate dehydratase large subunit [Gammaproteobacteria bacterium]|jgi:3-isopropylmalate/(R)-2-methylmalate dehydratase large subunit
MAGKTLYDKLWDDHLVDLQSDGTALIYIDRHLVHEVTSPQAFEGLHLANRKPWRTDSMLAVPDHNVPTVAEAKIDDPVSRLQIETLDKNCAHFGIKEFQMHDQRQGIVHVIGPEQGATLPGMTVVCGDSHTSTHGAFGALAFGIGTSEVEHVMATQCLLQRKSKNMRITVSGKLQAGVTSKDVVLAIIGQIGTAGGTGYAIEFAGSVIEELSVEGRMTVCNMAIEAGARSGMVAVDKKTMDYFNGRPFAPKEENWDKAVQHWVTLNSDNDAVFDSELQLDGELIQPTMTWGTSPEMVIPVNGVVPTPNNDGITAKESMQQALDYMGLEGGTPTNEIKVDKIFIGSCTNSRIEDLRSAASVVKGKKLADNIDLALVVPGSGLVKLQAEKEGLDQIFLEAGFEWRNPGCSMCLAMNDDKLESGERCASTSNRNFEGRQGQGGRTHLVSPATAAATAIAGYFISAQGLEQQEGAA